MKQHQLDRASHLDTLVVILRNMLTAYQSPGSKEERFDAIESVLADESQAILQQCEAHMAYANNNYLPFMLPLYRSKRAVLLSCLESLELRLTTSDQSTLEARRLSLNIAQATRPG